MSLFKGQTRNKQAQSHFLHIMSPKIPKIHLQEMNSWGRAIREKKATLLLKSSVPHTHTPLIQTFTLHASLSFWETWSSFICPLDSKHLPLLSLLCCCYLSGEVRGTCCEDYSDGPVNPSAAQIFRLHTAANHSTAVSSLTERLGTLKKRNCAFSFIL